MGRDTEEEQISQKTLVCRIQGMDEARVRRDVEYRRGDAGALTLDVYHPPDWRRGTRTPAVVIVAGFPDPGFETKVGCKFKEMGSTVS